jgi:transposase
VDLEARVRGDHPLRVIRVIANEALTALEREFAPLYAPVGRPSLAAEKLLRAMLLQAFYSIRSEGQLVDIHARKPIQPTRGQGTTAIVAFADRSR